jgi:hypothetical protein
MIEAVRLANVTRIWDRGAHNAFTDLIRWRGQWFCTFREGDDHVGGDGHIRVLTSPDGAQWTPAAFIGERAVDLRDPKLSVTPDDRLMIVAGGSVYDGEHCVSRQPRVTFSADGRSWSPPQRILAEGDWLWRVTWHEGRAYGVSYKSMAPEWVTTLMVSQDGLAFDEITTFEVPGFPNETTIRVTSSGEMVALVRREAGNRLAWAGRSQPPYTRWQWRETQHRIGGPNFIQLPNGELWAAGRSHGSAQSGVPHITTAIGRLTAHGAYHPELTLPSGGDTGYPGLVWFGDALWISYYSSHEGKASVYIALVKIE